MVFNKYRGISVDVRNETEFELLALAGRGCLSILDTRVLSSSIQSSV